MICLIGNGNPGFTHWGHQGDAFVEEGLVVAEVGLGEAQADVGVQVGQVGGEIATNIHVQAGFEALVHDPNGALERLCLELKVFGSDGAAGRCDSVKKARVWLTDHGVDYVFHDFKKQGVPPEAVDLWLKHMSWDVLVNRKGTTWRKLDPDLQASVVDNASARALMLEHASVVKRPVLVKGQTVVVGVNPEAWRSVIN